MLCSLFLAFPYLGAVIGNFPEEIRRILYAKRYALSSAEVISIEESGGGKYSRTTFTLRIGSLDLQVPQADLEQIGALPFLFPSPKVGEKTEVYVDGEIVSQSTTAFAGISLLVKGALIAWIVFVAKLAFANEDRLREPFIRGRRRAG